MRSRNPFPSLLFAAALLAGSAGTLGACASDADDGRAGGGAADTGSGPPRRADETPRGPPTVESFSAETRAFMEDGLKQFSRDDPRWPETRARWVAMGGRETDFLVETLWAALLRMQKLSQPANVERARHELALIGEPSVPLLAGVLAAGRIGTATDPATGEEVPVMMDDLQRQEASEILTIVGPAAVPAVAEAFERAETKSGRRWAVRTLGNMGDRGGDAAAAALVAAAGDADEFLRVEAVHSMQYRTDAATREALLAALGDGEELVRTKAAESLARRRDAGAAPSIRAAAESARAAGRIGEAKRLEQSAAWLEQHAGEDAPR